MRCISRRDLAAVSYPMYLTYLLSIARRTILHVCLCAKYTLLHIKLQITVQCRRSRRLMLRIISRFYIKPNSISYLIIKKFFTVYILFPL